MAKSGNWFTADQGNISRALARVAKVVERRNTIPILSNVLLTASAMDGTLQIRATDLDLEATAWVTVTASNDFTTTVAAAMLSDIIRKLPDGGEVRFEESEDKRQLIVKSGRLRVGLHTLPAEDYPVLGVTDFPVKFAIDVGILLGLLKRVEFAISTEETRYYLNGVFTEHKTVNGRALLRMVATDGHRLAMVQADAPNGFAALEKIVTTTGSTPGVIIPRKTVHLIIKLLEEAMTMKGGADKTVSVAISDTKIKVAWGVSELVSKLIDGTFPPYEKVIPEAGNIHAIINRHELAEASERVTTIASDRGRAVKLTFVDSAVQLEVNNPDAGAATDETPCVYVGPEMKIGFNSRYLADCMKIIEGENAVINLKGEGDPALFHGEGLPDHLIVLMPMRV